ncbi:MAG: hypothetical protein HOW73_44500 [Polyangiaceae bacterium]|nr:hypothetical protein [Polyangiaceae bacterium]
MSIGLIGAGALSIGVGCKGASSASGECLSYSCDEDGAKAMLWATVDETYQPSERAKTALGQVIDAGASKMKQDQGFTPESFELARQNMKKFLDEVPEGGEDPLGPAAEDLAKKTAKICPIFPFC